MIEKTTAYRVGEQVFPTIQEAQKSELLALLASGSAVPTDHEKRIVDAIVAHTDEVVSILTCEPKGKKPRSDRGKRHQKRTESAPTT